MLHQSLQLSISWIRPAFTHSVLCVLAIAHRGVCLRFRSLAKRTPPTKKPFWARLLQRGKLFDAVLDCVKCRVLTSAYYPWERKREGKESHILAWVNQRWRGITKAQARSGFWICYYLHFIRCLLNAYCISNHCLSISNPGCSLWAFFTVWGLFLQFWLAKSFLLCKNIWEKKKDAERERGRKGRWCMRVCICMCVHTYW